MLAPMLASLLICAALVPLGRVVISRGVVFADLAIAQWAALGSLAGPVLFGIPMASVLVGVPVTSLLFALLASGLVGMILLNFRGYREALIGTIYILGASLATLVVSNDPHGAQRLGETLSGDLLWTTIDQLYPMIVITMLALAHNYLLPVKWQKPLFLPVFALTVTLCVQLAGIYVVFATLIVTPLIVCHIRSKPVIAAIILCSVAHMAGLAGSLWFDTPAGVLIVIAIIILAVLAGALLSRPSSATTTHATKQTGQDHQADYPADGRRPEVD